MTPAVKQKYNLNSVSENELKSIPGLTEVDAILIAKYREQYGQYKSVDDLKNIPGFINKYDGIKDFFYVEEVAAPLPPIQSLRLLYNRDLWRHEKRQIS